MIDATFIEIATGIGGLAGGLWMGQSQAKNAAKKKYELVIENAKKEGGHIALDAVIEFCNSCKSATEAE